MLRTLTVLLGTLTLTIAARAQEPQLASFLRQSIGLGTADLGAVERGEAVTKVLETENPRDVAIFGIVTTGSSRANYVGRLANLHTALNEPSRVQFGIFGSPATLADIKDLEISREDVEELRNCRPNACSFKLPATEMQRLRNELVGSTAEQQARVAAYARQRLVTYVNDYRSRGDSALVVYDDRGTVQSSDAFASLLAQSPYVYKFVPSLARYFADYPRDTLAGAREIVFWAQDDAPRLRRILSVNQLVLYSPPELPAMTLVARKQIYANHYFEGAFELTSIIDRPTAAGYTDSYLLVLRRYRFDNLPGGLLNIRGRVVGALREKMLADLRRQGARARG